VTDILPDPISGGDTLMNPGVDDRWTCPNCYADHVYASDGDEVDCDCGATLRLTVQQQPVCHAEAIAFTGGAA